MLLRFLARPLLAPDCAELSGILVLERNDWQQLDSVYLKGEPDECEFMFVWFQFFSIK